MCFRPQSLPSDSFGTLKQRFRWRNLQSHVTRKSHPDCRNQLFLNRVGRESQRLQCMSPQHFGIPGLSHHDCVPPDVTIRADKNRSYISLQNSTVNRAKLHFPSRTYPQSFKPLPQEPAIASTGIHQEFQLFHPRRRRRVPDGQFAFEQSHVLQSLHVANQASPRLRNPIPPVWSAQKSSPKPSTGCDRCRSLRRCR